MPRYWIQHGATTLGIAALGLGAGIAFDALGNQGSVPYLQGACHFLADASRLLGVGGALLYGIAGIPYVMRREREQRIEDLHTDAAEFDAHADRQDARNDYRDVLGGSPRRRGPRPPHP